MPVETATLTVALPPSFSGNIRNICTTFLKQKAMEGEISTS